MKRVFLTSVAILTVASSPHARPHGWGGCDERCWIDAQRVSPGDENDDEIVRPGPRGEDGGPIDLAPPKPSWDDELTEPGPPADDDTPSDDDVGE